MIVSRSSRIMGWSPSHLRDGVRKLLAVARNRTRLVVAVDDGPRRIPVGELVGKELPEPLAGEIAVNHAADDDLERNRGLERTVRALHERAAERQFRVLALVILFPRQL